MRPSSFQFSDRSENSKEIGLVTFTENTERDSALTAFVTATVLEASMDSTVSHDYTLLHVFISDLLTAAVSVNITDTEKLLLARGILG